MARIMTLLQLSVGLVLFSTSTYFKSGDHPQYGNCDCDTLIAARTIAAPDFNRISRYDTTAFPPDSLYEITAAENRRLWYRDVENPDTTKFTKYWNAYFEANYHASHLDFVEYYKDRPGIEIAFQIGPNMDLWAYHILVIKKINCCYLVTRSYFRHARFTHKAYAILGGIQLDSLYEVLDPIKKSDIDSVEPRDYKGYFVDNRNKNTYYINLSPKGLRGKFPKELDALFDFLDTRIRWTTTYSL
jgi:hypothetical protein